MQDLTSPAEVGREQADARIDLLKQVQRDFRKATYGGIAGWLGPCHLATTEPMAG